MRTTQTLHDDHPDASSSQIYFCLHVRWSLMLKMHVTISLSCDFFCFHSLADRNENNDGDKTEDVSSLSSTCSCLFLFCDFPASFLLGFHLPWIRRDSVTALCLFCFLDLSLFPSSNDDHSDASSSQTWSLRLKMSRQQHPLHSYSIDPQGRCHCLVTFSAIRLSLLPSSDENDSDASSHICESCCTLQYLSQSQQTHFVTTLFVL